MSRHLLRLQNIRAGLFDDEGRGRMEHARLDHYGTRQPYVVLRFGTNSSTFWES